MADNIFCFTFSAQQLRAVLRNGEPWFVAADAIGALQLDRKALERLDDDEKGVNSIHTLGGAQHMTVINESGLYSLILSSRKPEAKRFKKWVTSEVLPSIRKIGRYESPGRPPVAKAPAPLLTRTRSKFRSRDDLSFTKRDPEGRLINWFMPSRVNNWHEHYGIGEAWFNEIVELAQHCPKEAFNAMRFAGPELARYSNHGHPDGFYDRMARWAVAAMLTTRSEPSLPFDVPAMGIPPREGLGHHLAAAAPQTLRLRS